MSTGEKLAEPGRHLVGLPKFMFPDPVDRPAFLFQCSANLKVSSLVPGDFRIPIIQVALRHSAMLGAAMPKASINEYGQAFLTKNEVWASG